MSEPLVMRCNVCGTSWVSRTGQPGNERCPHAAAHPALASERERAERLSANFDSCAAQRDKARREAGEALAEVDRLRATNKRLAQEVVMDSGQREDDLRERASRAEAERDEARDALEHAYAEGGALYEAKIAQAEAEAERDDVRQLTLEEVAAKIDRHAAVQLGPDDEATAIRRRCLESVAAMVRSLLAPPSPLPETTAKENDHA